MGKIVHVSLRVDDTGRHRRSVAVCRFIGTSFSVLLFVSLYF